MPPQGNPQRQSKRKYSASGSRIGGSLARGLTVGARVLGQTLAGSSGVSSKESMKKHGVHFPGTYKAKQRVVTSKRASHPFEKINLSQIRKKVAKQMLKNRAEAHKKRSRYPNQITYSQLQKLYPVWVKEFGERDAKEYMRAAGAPVGVPREHTEFRGIGRRSVTDVEEGLLTRRKGKVRRENTHLAVAHVQGVSPGYEAPQHRGGVSQEEFMEVAEEMGKLYGSRVKERIKRAAGAEKIEDDKGQGSKKTRFIGWSKRASSSGRVGLGSLVKRKIEGSVNLQQAKKQIDLPSASSQRSSVMPREDLSRESSLSSGRPSIKK